MNNYPDTTSPNDPDAPWNEEDGPEFIPVGCFICGHEKILNIESICEDCFLEQET